MNFSNFKQAVAKNFKFMSTDRVYESQTEVANLFVVDVDKDTLWDMYLNSFPEGTNNLFRVRSEHDGSYDKSFIRQMGAVVSIVSGKLHSIWDITLTDPEDAPYQVVADALSNLVKLKAIDKHFFHYEKSCGVNKNVEQLSDGNLITWEHFFVNIPNKFVMLKADIPSKVGELRSEFDVFNRALKEISPESVSQILDLIAQNSIYRGADHKFTLEKFQSLQFVVDLLPENEVSTYAWSCIGQIPPFVSKVRNTSIGTLLVALSEGEDLEVSVSKFEQMVAPTNYRRPTALVTPAMVAKAKAEIKELGLESALERRYATIEDININDILYVDRGARKFLESSAFDDAFETVSNSSKPPEFKKVTEVTIGDFISKVLPTAHTVEVLLENRFEKNLISLIAPEDPTANPLFKWENNFSWSYNGDITDSFISEKVKDAGGSVEGDLCCRLAWFNYDDLDLHMIEPDGNEVYFRNRGLISRCGGMLDVDMNAGGGKSRSAVENIFYKSKKQMQEGDYKLFVHNFSQREKVDVGFVVEIDMEGSVSTFEYSREVPNGDRVQVATINYSTTQGLKIVESLEGTTAQKDVWGIKTNTFHRVNVLMRSPNFWNYQKGNGNEHFFFMLEGCKNAGEARGFYNEFLKPELNQHRKVLEMVGSKMKAKQSDSQLSGVGFSTTQRNSVTVRVTGATTRILKVLF